jgi:hypothetical protein
MTRFQFWGLTLWVVALTVCLIPVAWSNAPARTTTTQVVQPRSTADAGMVCQIYSLSGLGDEFGQWVSMTLPQLIEPGSWTCPCSYYAPGKVLIVKHSPAVHVEVAAFLKNVTRAIAENNKSPAVTQVPGAMNTFISGLTPAGTFKPDLDVNTAAVAPQYSAPPGKASRPEQNDGSSYPIPATRKQPKHLFHFIIRYEGAGIIDSTVADVIKAQIGRNTDESTPPTPAAATPIPPSPPPAPPAVEENNNSPKGEAPTPKAKKKKSTPQTVPVTSG